jgi:hypothetical protein
LPSAQCHTISTVRPSTKPVAQAATKADRQMPELCFGQGAEEPDHRHRRLLRLRRERPRRRAADSRLATSPTSTGSTATPKTIGIVEVASFATNVRSFPGRENSARTGFQLHNISAAS